MENALTKIGKIRSVKWKHALCKIKKPLSKIYNPLLKNGKFAR
jgi:hypothetical protein